jgi:hypothetical protein
VPLVGNRLSSNEEARRLRIYLKAENDRQAAVHGKMSPMTWRLWRQSRGLPPPGLKLDEATKRMVAGLLALHTSQTLTQALKQTDRAVEGTFVSRGNHVDEAEDARRVAAYRKYRNDVAAANSLDMPRSTFRIWRQARNLPPKNPQGKPSAHSPRPKKWVPERRSHRRPRPLLMA